MFKSPTILLSLLLAWGAHGVTPVQPPLPPVNWEADADRRFDPPVEEVVLAMAGIGKSPSADDVRSHWQNWGVAATEPLRALMKEPRWEPFSAEILRLFYACPLEEGQPVLLEEMTRLADAAAESGYADGQAKSFRKHLFSATASHPQLAAPLLDHENEKVRFEVAGALVRATGELTESTKPVLDALAASEDEADRLAALGMLNAAPSPENDARALEVAATISAEQVRRTRAHQERLKPYARAQEPMSLVLGKERKR